MMTKFSSVDDLLKNLQETKFDYVVIPREWVNKFSNLIKVSTEEVHGPTGSLYHGTIQWLHIKDKKFMITHEVAEGKLFIVKTC